jgi:hypothetical protein
MRKQTLAAVCSLLSFAVVFGLRALAHLLNVRLPLAGYASPFLVSFVLIPILIVPLARLNTHLLAWRKARGRDIEEEEKYENVTADIISLRPTQPDTELTSRRRY